MNDIRELYQEMILDHSRSPRNFGPRGQHNLSAKGYNPLCGDDVEIHVLRTPDGVVKEICFEGSGCAISTASASILTGVLMGRGEEEVREIFAGFRQMVSGQGEGPTGEGLGKLAVFSGVKQFPARVKCATLAWHTLIQALSGIEEEVRTE
ncbi:MAG: SUF system NifU family Fe-S cluster assembly protein [Planctomycetota bacterium]|nr:SUF system NifU family Fe-S cluster assembly protein [Planctomycetota bacterium]